MTVSRGAGSFALGQISEEENFAVATSVSLHPHVSVMSDLSGTRGHSAKLHTPFRRASPGELRRPFL